MGCTFALFLGLSALHRVPAPRFQSFWHGFCPLSLQRIITAVNTHFLPRIPPARFVARSSRSFTFTCVCLGFLLGHTSLAQADSNGNKNADQAGSGTLVLSADAGEDYSVEDRLDQFAARVQYRLKPSFTAAGLPYPLRAPAELAMVVFKDSRVLSLYGRNHDQEAWRHIKTYPVLAASGVLGPKLREGDLQVPEGIYQADFLNPNSRYHLSIRLNYPNAFDVNKAAFEGRSRLGGDIMVHGSALSEGCLAVGDNAAEDLFVVSALLGKERVRVVISPTDFRQPKAQMPAAVVSRLPWAAELYADLQRELQNYPLVP